MRYVAEMKGLFTLTISLLLGTGTLTLSFWNLFSVVNTYEATGPARPGRCRSSECKDEEFKPDFTSTEDQVRLLSQAYNNLQKFVPLQDYTSYKIDKRDCKNSFRTMDRKPVIQKSDETPCECTCACDLTFASLTLVILYLCL